MCLCRSKSAPSTPIRWLRMHVLPVGLRDDLGKGLDLAGDDLGGLVGLALLEVLSDAEDDVDANLEGGSGLSGQDKSAHPVSASVGERRTLVAMSSSDSPKRVLRSEWPRMTQGSLRSLSW